MYPTNDQILGRIQDFITAFNQGDGEEEEGKEFVELMRNPNAALLFQISDAARNSGVGFYLSWPKAKDRLLVYSDGCLSWEYEGGDRILRFLEGKVPGRRRDFALLRQALANGQFLEFLKALWGNLHIYQTHPPVRELSVRRNGVSIA